MQPSRGRSTGPLAVAGAVGLGAVAVVLVVLASSAGSVSPVSESTGTFTPRPAPSRPEPTRPTDTPRLPTAGPDIEPFDLPDWLIQAVATLALAAAALLVLLLLRALFEVVRGIRVPAAEEVDASDWDKVVAERLEDAVEDGLGRVDAGSPDDAIIACWVALERAAAEAGAERAPAETPSEFTVRVLAVGSVSEPPLRRLAGLYREARFSTHGLAESARGDARAALEVLRRELADARSRRDAEARREAEAADEDPATVQR